MNDDITTNENHEIPVHSLIPIDIEMNIDVSK
jgi:hypothetical protein